jgi:hypothetical protein
MDILVFAFVSVFVNTAGPMKDIFVAVSDLRE